MFSFFRKRTPFTTANFSALGADMHSHLLPGIDDGAPEAAVSATLKKGLEEIGFNRFIATPHILWDMYKNTPETIGAALARLQQEHPHENLRAAAEYYLDEHFDTLLDNNERLLTLDDKKVLVEFSFVSAPIDLREKLFQLQIKGYTPVIAHPERYTYFAASKQVYEEFKTMGCLLQVNLLSLAGYYGKPAQELAEWLSARNLVDFVGTDLHHERHLDVLRNSKTLHTAYQKLLDSGRLQNHELIA